ncbi:MAG: hypothetical protein LBS27_03960 [Bifidobacteriaceae bacterium]|nr:hypothetical protein [Bifidobacteriaceae bacterium]
MEPGLITAKVEAKAIEATLVVRADVSFADPITVNPAAQKAVAKAELKRAQTPGSQEQVEGAPDPVEAAQELLDADNDALKQADRGVNRAQEAFEEANRAAWTPVLPAEVVFATGPPRSTARQTLGLAKPRQLRLRLEIGAALGLLSVVFVSMVKDWTPVLDLRLVAAAALVGMATGVLSGLAPAIRAARIEPAAALQEGP